MAVMRHRETATSGVIVGPLLISVRTCPPPLSGIRLPRVNVLDEGEHWFHDSGTTNSAMRMARQSRVSKNPLRSVQLALQADHNVDVLPP